MLDFGLFGLVNYGHFLLLFIVIQMYALLFVLCFCRDFVLMCFFISVG